MYHNNIFDSALADSCLVNANRSNHIAVAYNTIIPINLFIDIHSV